jgi:conjugative transfer signal peptidase TraF
MKRPWGSLIAAALAAAALLGAWAAGLHWNGTASMPEGLWLVSRPDGAVRRGEIVTLCPSGTMATIGLARGYLEPGDCPDGSGLILKRIVAVPGDEVTVTEEGIAVNGTLIRQSRPLLRDEAGRPMNPVAPGVYHVGPEQVWVISTHDPRSFDSRYVGPVPAANVRGKARPLLVWG